MILVQSYAYMRIFWQLFGCCVPYYVTDVNFLSSRHFFWDWLLSFSSFRPFLSCLKESRTWLKTSSWPKRLALLFQLVAFSSSLHAPYKHRVKPPLWEPRLRLLLSSQSHTLHRGLRENLGLKETHGNTLIDMLAVRHIYIYIYISDFRKMFNHCAFEESFLNVTCSVYIKARWPLVAHVFLGHIHLRGFIITLADSSKVLFQVLDSEPG